jgi:hypothetical protein
VPDDPDGEPPLPHPASEINASARIGVANTGQRLRFATSRNAAPNKSTVQAIGIAPGGKLPRATVPAVDAVVFTVTVTLAAVLEFTWTVAGTLQVGPSITAGLTLQAMSTAPLNDPEGVIVRLKDALLPGVTVAEVGDPDTEVIAKVFAAVPVPESVIVCGLPGPSSETVTVPIRPPVVIGVNITEIRQLPPAARDVLQVLVSPKSPEAAIAMMSSGLLPVFINVTV